MEENCSMSVVHSMTRTGSTRRELLAGMVVASLALPSFAVEQDELITSIEKVTLRRGRTGWFDSAPPALRSVGAITFQ